MYRVVKDQKELIVQLEGDLLNVRKLPASIYRGEGVGAASSPSNTELVTKAIQDVVNDEGHYELIIFILSYN